jgi:hypothetical protein
MSELGGGGDTSADHPHWRTAEALGHAYYLERGWRVLVSLYDNSVYDFVVERDGVYQRVNVKRASVSNGGYLIGHAGGRDPGCGMPDLYLVWLRRERQFVELPGDFLDGKLTRRITKDLIQCISSSIATT